MVQVGGPVIADPKDWIGVESGRDVSAEDRKIRELYEDPRQLTYVQIGELLGLPNAVINRRIIWMIRNDGLKPRETWHRGGRKVPFKQKGRFGGYHEVIRGVGSK